MNPLKSSLYWRLLISFFLASLLVLFLGGLLARGFIEYSTAREIDWNGLAQDAGEAYDSGGAAALTEWSRQQRRDDHIEATLFEDGRPLTPMRRASWIAHALPGWLAAGRNQVYQPRPRVWVAVQAVQGADGRQRQLVGVSFTHTLIPRQLRGTILLSVQGILSLLVIGLVGWWVARGVARPVEALRAAARRMSAGDLSARVGGSGSAAHDELAQLADDFDAMAERLEALVTHDRRVLQDLSHELRSPLARLQLILDLARRPRRAQDTADYFAQAEREIERLDRMTGDMLALSRMEGGLPGMQAETLDLVALTRACIERATLSAHERDIALHLEHADAATIHGSAALLERVLDNLLVNAIKFSADGGRVEVAIVASSSAVELSVRDHGRGVPEAELDSLFRPFFRGSNAAEVEGTGLGLAIVQRVVQAHGGHLGAANARDGGLQVTLWLPRDGKVPRIEATAR